MMKKLLLNIGMVIFLFACINDESIYEKKRLDLDSDPDLKNYITNQRGLFIVNEGNFMYDNASLSYYLIDSMKVLNNLFERVNGLPIGDVAYSMVIHNGLGYIIINNSGKVYVIDIYSFKVVGKITGLVSPRHIHLLSDTKAYITDLYAKSITIVNPRTFRITGSISVDNHETRFYQHPTEQMVQLGNKVFVNCWSYDNKILVIDSEKDLIIDSIEVISQPNSMIIDRYNKLWVLSDGGAEGNPYAYERPGLTRINPETMEIEKIFRFKLEDNPLSLNLNSSKDTLFLINHHVWKMAVESSIFPQVPFVINPYHDKTTGGFFSLTVDPVNSDIYVGDAIDNVQCGCIYRFSLSGEPIDTFQTGIIPGSFCFKR
jgi:DNA-binding beta-propeller fold protein YncE